MSKRQASQRSLNAQSFTKKSGTPSRALIQAGRLQTSGPATTKAKGKKRQMSEGIVVDEKTGLITKTAEDFERALQDKIILNCREVRYALIKQVAKKSFGWKCTRWKPDKETKSAALTHAKADWDIAWIDADFCIDKMRGLKPYQRINHFPGMTIISLKNNLAKYLKLMQKEYPQDFNFFPKTWIFPYESHELMSYVQAKKNNTFIVKPMNSSQGKGIFLTRRIKEIPRQGCHVVQRYLNNPYLIDRKKFDFRIYVLVTQVAPEI